VIGELEGLTSLGQELGRRARDRGTLLVWRAQAKQSHHVLVRSGRTEETSLSRLSGHGIQIYTAEGRTALASRDDFRADAALDLFDVAATAAERADGLAPAGTAPPALEPTEERAVPEVVGAFDRIDARAVAARLGEIESEVAGRVPGLALRVGFQADLDAWRVLRSDGGDVLFAMPRCTLRLAAISSRGDETHSVTAAVAGPDPGLPWDASRMAVFMKRALRAARLVGELSDAPPHPAGSFPLVIDYGLAKGLAHEAFGHASEADGFRSSILASGGKFRLGERVGAGHVSIVDEPLEGDHAWQPFSANGVRRERATIVDHGCLCDGLSDPWSAGPGGVRLTGAARASSFRRPPLPRMSNIRIETDDPLPAPGGFEDYGPEEVRDLLAGAGVLERHPTVAFLSGYRGGQVNTATGDFVFNCRAIYRISRDGIGLCKPAIFSGSMFGALESIREAFGPLLLDAVGTCGKWGQGVPSSGGSHYFLVLEPHPAVRLGGR
jgi:TldD protein